MTNPPWFSALSWSASVPIEELRLDRQRLPRTSGVYVFTNYPEALEKNFGVLYVGKAKSLFKRVQSYLVDPENLLVMSQKSGGTRLSTSLRHTGKNLLLIEVQQKYRAEGLTKSFIWVRWHECASPHTLESQLIQYLQPAFNTQGRATDDA
ncbi:hypothetical protein [Roseateles sp. P5_E7]